MAVPTVPSAPGGRTGALPLTPSYRRPPLAVRIKRSARRQLLPFLLLLPALILVGGVLGYPIGQVVATSFQQLGISELFHHNVVWDGLSNYRQLFSSSQFGDVLGQTFLFTSANVALTMLIGTAVAILLGRLSKTMRTVVSIAMLLAWAMPNEAASIVWAWLFETQYGLVNYVLANLGFSGFNNHAWFASSVSAYSVITMMVVWQAVPFVALTMYAALTQVPSELFEAATVDGAARKSVFRHIVFPLVRPVFILLTVLSIIWDSTVFNQIWFLTGGNAQAVNTVPLGVWTYIEAFSSDQYGLGAAVAVVTVVLLLLVTGYYIRVMVRTGEARA